MLAGQAADLAIFLFCSALLAAYNVFYFKVRSFTLLGRHYINLYAVNRTSRADWVHLLSKGGHASSPCCSWLARRCEPAQSAAELGPTEA